MSNTDRDESTESPSVDLNSGDEVKLERRSWLRIDNSLAIRLGYFGGLFIVIAIFFRTLEYFNIYDISKDLGVSIENVSLATGLFTCLMAAFLASGIYLEVFGENEIDKKQPEQATRDDRRRYQASLEYDFLFPRSDRIEKQLQPVVEKIFRRTIRDHIEEKNADSIQQIAQDRIIAKYAPQVVNEKKFDIIQNHINRFISGLQEQIGKQQRNANFNVWAGMVFAVAGLAVMFFFVYYNSVDNETVRSMGWDQFARTFVPKISFVIIFESIAFFFFQAYRDDRSMVRYLRNEATNVESRLIGLSSAILFGDNKMTSDTIKSLMSTERNFSIKKGERLILEVLQKDHPILFETIANRLVPNLGGKNQPQQTAGPINPTT